jgi:hypothetical protein
MLKQQAIKKKIDSLSQLMKKLDVRTLAQLVRIKIESEIFVADTD